MNRKKSSLRHKNKCIKAKLSQDGGSTRHSRAHKSFAFSLARVTKWKMIYFIFFDFLWLKKIDFSPFLGRNERRKSSELYAVFSFPTWNLCIYRSSNIRSEICFLLRHKYENDSFIYCLEKERKNKVGWDIVYPRVLHRFKSSF